MSSTSTKRIAEKAIRKLFNDGDFWARALRGEFKTLTLQSYPAPREAHQRPGAKSEVIEYRDLNGRVALVFQYTNPDGSLGASGKPDPKALLIDNTIYIADKSIKD
jgi:hypothetical protein